MHLHFRRRLAPALAFGLCLLAGPTRADDDAPAFDLDRASEVTAAMSRDASLAEDLAACPADVFGKRTPYSERWLGLYANETVETRECEQKPALCRQLCIENGRKEYCFRLALALEAHEEQIAPRFAQMMYARACALGHSGACTNRGAHMRNRDDEGNPARIKDERAQNLCQFRTFKLDCDTDNPWGCAMLAQAYRYGEGVPADAAAARRLYDKACGIKPQFPACDFSKRALQAMDGKSEE